MGLYILNQASLVAPIRKESTCNTGDPGSIPGSGKSPGEENGYPLQYSWGLPGGSDGKKKNLSITWETWV